MGEGAGVEGWRRSGVLVGSCEGSDDELEGVAGSGKLEEMLGGELDVGWRGRGGDTAGVAAVWEKVAEVAWVLMGEPGAGGLEPAALVWESGQS